MSNEKSPIHEREITPEDLVNRAKVLLDGKVPHPGYAFKETYRTASFRQELTRAILRKPMLSGPTSEYEETQYPSTYFWEFYPKTDDEKQLIGQLGHSLVRTLVKRNGWGGSVSIRGYQPAMVIEGKVIPMEGSREELYTMDDRYMDSEGKSEFLNELVILNAEGVLLRLAGFDETQKAIDRGESILDIPQLNIRGNIELDPIRVADSLLRKAENGSYPY